MKWFLNLKTGAKLFLGFSALILLLGIVMATAYHAITNIQASERKLFDKDIQAVELLAELRVFLNRQRTDIVQMMLTTNHEDLKAIETDLRDRTKESDVYERDLLALLGDDLTSRQRLTDLEGLRKEYRKDRDKQIELIYEGRVDEAKQMSLTTQRERYEKIRNEEVEIAKLVREKAKTNLAASEEQARQSVVVFQVIGAIAIVLCFVAVYAMNEVIAKPLKKMTHVAERIATRDLTVEFAASDRNDEVGNLGLALRQMQENLRRTTTELAEGVNILASSSSQILAATTQVATSASETATAITETTTTVEEVKQTAQVANQKARHVSDSALKASQVAASGKKAVDQTIEGMQRIQAQMESIAESVVKLSEQGQAIGEIIATVNDLAEQSNLLAVNAAIEAAKAGEQGKGFSVVAQEVKSLAEQSKQATAQVRAILNDIQKATSAAVMATEQGSKAVESGTKQSTDAGESIRVLADNIAQAAQAASQIAASNQQQLVGTDQVALAMENIKQASLQNISGTKQAESAAHNLHELGQKLKKQVDQYKV